MLVTGYQGLLLFRNQGDGTFTEVAQSLGLTDTLWSSSAAWGDVDGDGLLDLYVTHYVDWSFENDPQCDSGDRICGTSVRRVGSHPCRIDCIWVVRTGRFPTRPARQDCVLTGRDSASSWQT